MCTNLCLMHTRVVLPLGSKVKLDHSCLLLPELRNVEGRDGEHSQAGNQQNLEECRHDPERNRDDSHVNGTGNRNCE
jgi:hypothetical protein